MDPCPFVKVLVGGLALRIPVAAKPTRAGIHSSTSPCFCEISFSGFDSQTAVIPLLAVDAPNPDSSNPSATFHLDQADLSKLLSKKSFCCGSSKPPQLRIRVFTGRQGSTCGVSLGKVLGEISVPLDLEGAHERIAVFQNGWVQIGNVSRADSKPGPQLHLSVRAEPDPRYVFQFDGEPECSPQVLQIQGSIRQPIFSCKFSRDRNTRSRSIQSESSNRSWLNTCTSGREKDRMERKGWLIMVHDLSGSPVAAASMVTPFVPSGSDRVSRSNPGAWLILRPWHVGEDNWKPWGRLEAWRERGSNDGLGFRFELTIGGGSLAGMDNGILLTESVISVSKRGKFVIDMRNGRSDCSPFNSPVSNPQSSGDFTYCQLPYLIVRGFVMCSTVQGEGKCSKPIVQIARRHMTHMEDAAMFVALAAAVDLGVDACQPFSQKLRKELYQQGGNS
eukprot:TRINITY_DN5705_c0_g1_i1.p1 TRINITY_DN5705_c0_g1~~TRINITY_DN5705_c0_g1_i1.p1  ORF type:complete len:447 (+),score=44.96 TRINITY_DN5705_c0_g1_i1:267-1607(+)